MKDIIKIKRAIDIQTKIVYLPKNKERDFFIYFID
jgi:hypothetical protein